MKKLILISLILAAVSLACLETSAIAEPVGPIFAATFYAPTENPAGAVYEIGDDLTLTPPLSLQGEGDGARRSCAVVIAEESLHLRGGPSEDDIVLTWLLHGEVVQVIDKTDLNWWLVDFNGRTGYARAMYLEERTC